MHPQPTMPCLHVTASNSVKLALARHPWGRVLHCLGGAEPPNPWILFSLNKGHQTDY